MPGTQTTHPTPEGGEQKVELYPPVDDDGWHSSQVRDWIPVSPELSDSAIRLYLILRSLVIEKRGPVRKLTLWELCHLLPRKPVGPGEKPEPSSISRIRSLLRQLTDIGLVTTPEGYRLTTSSRPLAAGRGLRLRINLMPTTAYTGPRNVFDVLDDVREAAETSAREARARELEVAAEKRVSRSETPGQESAPGRAGQKSDPPGQESDPRGQKSDPHPTPDLQEAEPPLSPPAQTPRPDPQQAPVRPSVQVETAREHSTEGRDDIARVETSPGVDLLHAIAVERPELLLTGPTLRDQGLMITGLLAAGWPSTLLRELVMRPLPDPLHKSVGAVISHRLRTAAAMPVPSFTARDAVPLQRPAPDLEHLPEQHDRAVPYPPSRELLAQQHDRLRRDVHGAPECAGDDGLCDRLAVVGEPMCARHLGWPLCPGHAGQACPVRTRDGEQCTGCRERDYHVHVIDRLLVPESDDGTCPGYNTPCGRPVVSTGLCLRCRLVSQKGRDRIEQEWQQGLAEAVAAASAEESNQLRQAPF